ncbi:hypothetical protein [Streptomyces sp. A5-4]|uniref:hypothetical protein n=1 Tax=Streptomyces sp. A5-4 TaxID=3384771 RepID=UPI003DA92A1E
MRALHGTPADRAPKAGVPVRTAGDLGPWAERTVRHGQVTDHPPGVTEFILAKPLS